MNKEEKIVEALKVIEAYCQETNCCECNLFLKKICDEELENCPCGWKVEE